MMRSVAINGDIIEYIEIGKGKPYIFVSGYLYPPQTYELREIPGYRIIAPYISGATYRKDPPITFEDHVKLLKEFCRYMKIKPAYIAGHSLGASIALECVSSLGAQAVYASQPVIPVRYSGFRHLVRYMALILLELMQKEKRKKSAEILSSVARQFLKKPRVSYKQIQGITKTCYSKDLDIKGTIALGLDETLFKKEDYIRYFYSKPFLSLNKRSIPGVGHNWPLHDPKLFMHELKTIL